MRKFAEGDVISLDVGLRMDVNPDLDLWDLVIEVFHSSPNQTNKTKYVREPRRNLSATPQSNMRKTDANHEHQCRSDQYHYVPSIGTHSGFFALLLVFEDNEAVIKGLKSHNETRVKNPQSCFGLVV